MIRNPFFAFVYFVYKDFDDIHETPLALLFLKNVYCLVRTWWKSIDE